VGADPFVAAAVAEQELADWDSQRDSALAELRLWDRDWEFVAIG